jgi:hypothetical protein
LFPLILPRDRLFFSLLLVLACSSCTFLLVQ